MSNHEHITLSELQATISGVLGEAMPSALWISAEIAEIKVNYSGHCYLELIEKSENSNSTVSVKAQARGVIWRNTYETLSVKFEQESGNRLANGMNILIKATVNYHPVYGLSLQIADIDPSYTMGDMERQKRQTITKLQNDGVWDMNHELPVPNVIQRIAVVSSSSAAGYRDFIQELNKSSYRFHIKLFDAIMQGANSESAIIEALSLIAEQESEFDIVAIIRGGGATSDLNCYNSYIMASYVAQFPLPVFTGIGHDKDISVVDMVAHTMLKTPTAVAVWLNERAKAFDAQLEYMALQLHEICSQTTHNCAMRLQSLSGDIQSLSRLNIVGALTKVKNADTLLKQLSISAIQCEKQRLSSFMSLADNYTPERILRLGFAIVRSENQLLQSIDKIHENDTISIELTDGVITANITGITSKQQF